jgi:hypothetical protein
MRGQTAGLPKMVADKTLKTVRNEFTGIVELEGGPQGMTIGLLEGVTVQPPITMLFPPGDHYITSYFPGFITRRDTLVVFQGKRTKKRILLLPLE